MKKKIIATAITLVNVGIMAVTLSNLPKQKEVIVDGKDQEKEGIVFLNDKIAIKYFDIDRNGGFDVIVETRNGYNVSSEWDMTDSQNHSLAYLVGSTKEDKKKFHEMNLGKYGYEFQWEENYDIKGVDVPYSVQK